MLDFVAKQEAFSARNNSQAFFCRSLAIAFIQVR